ncbi:MAG: DUF599 domain-containing protein [Rhodobacteraceae bacterium]|nr:DUF599 domain-containing protein [Paracoccaceae bacterium]
MSTTTISETLAFLSPLDAVALALLVLAWFVLGKAFESQNRKMPSVSVLMAHYRREWMHHSVTREPRVYDAIVVTSLRQGTAFFASTVMIALGSGLALLPNVDRLTTVASGIALAGASRGALEIKLIVALAFVANAFFKFVWSHRVFGYCSIVMAAVPNDPADPVALQRADQAAELNISAALAFNRGLRSVYFALGALAWLLGAVPLIVATVVTVAVLWRREFGSQTHRTLAREFPFPERPGRTN